MRSMILVAVAGLAITSIAAGDDVVVLRGGERIELKQPYVQQGNNALLTRKDGTLLSVPLTEIDTKATAAARRAPAAKPAPAAAAAPETPAEAARAGKDSPKARVRITDTDVAHAYPAEGEAKEGGESSSPASTLQVADYTQERSGGNLIIRGNLRNVGTVTASKATMVMAVVDDKGKVIGSTSATLAGSTVESGNSVAFSGMIPVGDKIVSAVRFTPLWNEPPPPPPAGAPANAANAAAAAAQPKGPPPPAPTPYGRGSLYANPAPQASSKPPDDGKSGYIPGAARPEDQPKPPD